MPLALQFAVDAIQAFVSTLDFAGMSAFFQERIEHCPDGTNHIVLFPLIRGEIAFNGAVFPRRNNEKAQTVEKGFFREETEAFTERREYVEIQRSETYVDFCTLFPFQGFMEDVQKCLEDFRGGCALHQEVFTQHLPVFRRIVCECQKPHPCTKILMDVFCLFLAEPPLHLPSILSGSASAVHFSRPQNLTLFPKSPTIVRNLHPHSHDQIGFRTLEGSEPLCASGTPLERPRCKKSESSHAQ